MYLIVFVSHDAGCTISVGILYYVYLMVSVPKAACSVAVVPCGARTFCCLYLVVLLLNGCCNQQCLYLKVVCTLQSLYLMLLVLYAICIFMMQGGI